MPLYVFHGDLEIQEICNIIEISIDVSKARTYVSKAFIDLQLQEEKLDYFPWAFN